MHADELLSKYHLISDQVSPEQLRVILRELEHVLDRTADLYNSSSCAFSPRGMERSVSKYGEVNPAEEKCVGAEEVSRAAGSARRQADWCKASVVEFGCYIGTTSLFIRRLLDARGESAQHPFHVYDSFVGLPEKSEADASGAGQQFVGGELAVSKKQFIHEFQKANLSLPVIHKGWFKDLAATDVPETIAFAFLDGDFYESIRDSLQLVLSRMLPGGVIIIDDYAREALPGVARAVHDYLPPERLLTLHTEQNLGIIPL